jgi:hypothetical protein
LHSYLVLCMGQGRITLTRSIILYILLCASPQRNKEYPYPSDKVARFTAKPDMLLCFVIKNTATSYDMTVFYGPEAHLSGQEDLLLASPQGKPITPCTPCKCATRDGINNKTPPHLCDMMVFYGPEAHLSGR